MLTLFKRSFFGPVTNEANKKLKDLNASELVSFIPLVAVVVWLGVYPKPVLSIIDNSVNTTLSIMQQKQ